MNTFIEKYNEVMGEARRTHAPYQQLVRTYKELLQSVGAHTDEVAGKDKLTNGLTTDTKLDALKASLKAEFAKDGINKDFKADLKKDGYDTLVKIADELKLWHDFPPSS